jgi:hypothetical protein
MKVFEVEPLEGVGEIKLGMTRQEVLDLMKSVPETSGSRMQVESYLGGGLQVFYGKDDQVEFIELLRSTGISAKTKGIDVFGEPAKVVLSQIAEFSEYNQDDPEVGYSYVFPDLELSLWRPNIPENEEEEDGKYFSTIGIGIPGYYSATTQS